MNSNSIYFKNIINTELSGLTSECSKNVKDNKSMNYSHYTYQVPRIFYHPNILEKIKDYIDDGKKSYDALDEYDQDQLTILCMNALGDDAYCGLIDHEDLFLTLHHLKKFIQTAKPEHAYDLAITMSKNAREHFSYDLKIVYDEHVELLKKLKLDEAA